MIKINEQGREAMIDKMLELRPDLLSTRDSAVNMLDSLLSSLNRHGGEWVSTGGFRLMRDEYGAELDYHLVSGYDEGEPFLWTERSTSTKAKTRLLNKDTYSNYFLEADSQHDLFMEIAELTSNGNRFVEAVAPVFDDESGQYTALVTVSS